MDKIKAFLRLLWADPAKRKRLLGASALLLLFVLGFWAGRASAADGVLTWTLPTACADGSPMTNCPLTGIRVERKLGAAGAWTTRATVGPTVTTYTDAGLPVGINFWRLFSVATTVVSAPTNEVSKDVVAPLPGSPGGFSVQVLVVYNVLKQVDRFVMIPVGTVPANTQYVTGQAVNGFCVVPRAAVKILVAQISATKKESDVGDTAEAQFEKQEATEGRKSLMKMLSDMVEGSQKSNEAVLAGLTDLGERTSRPRKVKFELGDDGLPSGATIAQE